MAGRRSFSIPSLALQLTALCPILPSLRRAGKREVFFEANGVPRVVEVADKKAELVVGKKAVRERADLSVLGSVGAPMAGTIIEVCIKPGSTVKPGQQLVVMNAMKMETAICAPVAGVVTQVGRRGRRGLCWRGGGGLQSCGSGRPEG